MITPSNDAFGESLSTLKFANRAKNIRNAPRINEDVDEKALLRKYEAELKRLRAELDHKNESMVNMQRMIDFGHSRRRDDESTDLFLEQDETRKLEERIKVMNSQLLAGGQQLEEHPQFITALEAHQKLIRQEYEGKLQEMERERQQIEEDKSQIDRYKQLLLRQRDIMIALTARLNERDETIIQLQEELDAYDKLHRETEESLEGKVAHCQVLESLLKTHNVPIPTDDTPDINYFKQPKRYAPYSSDSVKLDNSSFVPLQMLTAEEKISELTQIIDNQKGEVERLIRSANNTSAPEPEADRLKREKAAILSTIEDEALGFVESIYTGVSENSYSLQELLEDIQKLYDLLAECRTKLPPKENRGVQLHIPTQPPQKNGRRPLTVDEMLMIKRQEMNKRRDK